MIYKLTKALIIAILLISPLSLKAQLWSGILNPIGTGTCTGATPSVCAIDWTDAGIPGGIPSASWTQSGSTILASACSNGASDCASTIQTALNACGTNHFVLLGAGTFRINSGIGVKSNCELRGAGPTQTIINCFAGGNSCIFGGNNSGGGSDVTPSLGGAVSITGGLTSGSTSITVSSSAGISVGQYLVISQLNDPAYVSNSSAANNGGAVCNCDGGIGWTGTRNQGQIVEVTSKVGTTIGITATGTGGTTEPGLYYPYNRTPLAVPFSAVTKFAGVRLLQVAAQNTGTQETFYFGSCAYCWIDSVEANYTDGNWVEFDWGFHDQVSNSYLSNAYSHTSGTNDSNITIRTFTSGFKVENNIIERGHFPLMVEWGAAGGVIAYNYIHGQYDIVSFQGASQTINPCATSSNACSNTPAINSHGVHPQFNLVEGNVGNIFEPDNIWGSSSWFSTFRNWWTGTTKMCSNGIAGGDGKGTVNCTGAAGKFAWQIANAYEIEAFSVLNNLVGDVVGSAAQQALVSTQGGSSLGQVFQTTGACGAGVPTPCGANSRPFGSNADAFSFGYFSVSSDGGGAHDTSAPFSTALIHGIYTNMNNTTTWSGSLTHTLPNSFYLPSKPSWWTTGVAYPAIGPDIAGGTGPGGHASLLASNPAQNCYTNIMGGSEGGPGSPLTNFDPITCFASSNPITPAAMFGNIKATGSIVIR